MAFHTKSSEEYGNIRVKPNQPCNYSNRGHKSKVNIFGQYAYNIKGFINAQCNNPSLIEKPMPCNGFDLMTICCLIYALKKKNALSINRWLTPFLDKWLFCTEACYTNLKELWLGLIFFSVQF